MNISGRDAGEALDAIVAVDQKVREYKGYREASPFLILWGVLWFVANGVTGLAPAYAGRTWLVAVIAGALATVLLTIQQSVRAHRQHRYTAGERAQIGRRVAFIGTAMWLYFPAMFSILPPLSGMQNNALISLFWAFAYMVAGAWVGARLFFTGLTTVAAVLAGYLLLREHYFLWMAVVGGGSLILGGIWLRKL